MNGSAFQSILHANLDAAYATVRKNPPSITAMRSFVDMPNAQSGSAKYPIFPDAPAAKKFGGEVTYTGISSQDYELRNEIWGGAGLAFPRAWAERDQTDGIFKRIGMHLQHHMEVPYLEVLRTIMNNDVAYDGDNLFVTTGDRINSLAGAGRSLTNIESDIDEARTLMSLIKMANSGAIIDRQPNIILCHTAMETRIREGGAECDAAATGSNSRVANVVGGYIDQVIATSSSGHHRIPDAHLLPDRRQRDRKAAHVAARAHACPIGRSGGMSRILDGGYLTGRVAT